MNEVKDSFCLKAYVPTTRTQAAAWVAIFAFFFISVAALTGRDRMVAAEEALVAAPADPTYLSTEDRSLYAIIDQAQSKGDFNRADDAVQHLSNRGLLGYVLAERYTSAHYNARAEELKAWLANYSDLPQAQRIATLAKARGVKVELAKAVEPLRGNGYADHLGRSGMPDSWYSALNDWREGNIALAATKFEKIGTDKQLNDWQQSAAYFWAGRSAEKLGEHAKARSHFKQAAENDTTFYGLLAARELGRVHLAVEAPEVSDSLRSNPRAIRASLLAQLDRKEDAETELRTLYNEVPKHKRSGIVTIASELSLSNLQMRLARAHGMSDAEVHFAKFPMPQYMVELHPVMDSALLLAVARNESGFREDARNPRSGATGMMQMLPSTARAVEQHVSKLLVREANAAEVNAMPAASRLSEPATSARYGAEYLKMLSKQPSIDNNLIYLLVGYNAGPGTAASWKANTRHIQDPLMFIESIPYAETRNYVMQVMAQYWTYQLMMDESPKSLKALSNGQWPMLAANQ